MVNLDVGIILCSPFNLLKKKKKNTVHQHQECFGFVEFKFKSQVILQFLPGGCCLTRCYG